ncbi:MAG: hypothetical protein AAF402_16835, partial [Pseudomonadota bacterium]
MIAASTRGYQWGLAILLSLLFHGGVAWYWYHFPPKETDQGLGGISVQIYSPAVSALEAIDLPPEEVVDVFDTEEVNSVEPDVAELDTVDVTNQDFEVEPEPAQVLEVEAEQVVVVDELPRVIEQAVEIPVVEDLIEEPEIMEAVSEPEVIEETLVEQQEAEVRTEPEVIEEIVQPQQEVETVAEPNIVEEAFVDNPTPFLEPQVTTAIARAPEPAVMPTPAPTLIQDDTESSRAADIRQAYFSNVIRILEKQKRYPKRARRR